MPSNGYLISSISALRLESFWALMYGHLANYVGRGTLTATEQLPIQNDANGYNRDYLWSYLEGGIDECVPSILLPALGTQYAMVFERYDLDTLFVGIGAPSRWVPLNSTGWSVTRAYTRFGLVSFSSTVAGSQIQQVAVSTLTYTPTGSPGVSQIPRFLIKAQQANNTLSLQSVSVSGDADLVSFDPSTKLVDVKLVPHSPVLPYRIQISATFA
jgi:hypothetical protein